MTDSEAVGDPSPARRLVRYSGAPRAAWDDRFFRPVLEAEAARGNAAGWDFGDYQIPEAAIAFRGPIDVKALREEFDLDDGMDIRVEHGGGVRYYDQNGDIALVLLGAEWPRTQAMKAARETWWQQWRARPRPLTALHNPFIHPDALSPRTVPAPVVLDRLPEWLQLGRRMSSDLPGLGSGWSVWPFTGSDGEGLLVIAPKWFDLATARAAVDDSGGTDHPVLLTIRGQEPAPVTAALREARAEAKYLL